MKKLMVTMISASFLAFTSWAIISCSNNNLDSHVQEVGKMGDMSIIDMRSAVVNNLLIAQVTFHNDGKRVQTGFYRCQFYDANKMQVGEVEIWQPVSIYPNEDQVIKCMATQLEATEFKAEFSADGKNVSMYKYK